jgi:hypothetical protein
VRVTFRGIKEEIADSGAGDMLVLLRYVGEDDAGCYFRTGPQPSRLLEIRLPEIRET